jgi:hypothetical protein
MTLDYDEFPAEVGHDAELPGRDDARGPAARPTSWPR